MDFESADIWSDWVCMVNCVIWYEFADAGFYGKAKLFVVIVFRTCFWGSLYSFEILLAYYCTTAFLSLVA